MRRIVASVLLCVFLLGCQAFAEEAEVFSYDFVLRFHLKADVFPFRQRTHMQGYADMLDMLEFRGNVSWCPDTQCSDLNLEIIPLPNPSASVTARIRGIPEMQRITSPLLADKAVCFNPDAFLHVTVSAREVFQVQLPYLALMNPQTTISALSELAGDWTNKAGAMNKNGFISYDAVREIAQAWSYRLEAKTLISDWIKAVVDPMYNDGPAELDLNTLPQQLLDAAGGKPLTVRHEGGTTRIQNAAGFTFWEQTETEDADAWMLNVPENMGRYIPAFSAWRETADGKIATGVKAQWACAEETAQTDPETGTALKRLDLSITAEGLPVSLPAETDFSGGLFQQGTILPQFGFFLNGSVKEDGSIRASLTFADRPETGEVFFCEGQITPAVHEEPMAYTWEELSSEYNIFNLSYAAQGEIIDAVKRPLALGLIDFLYELPASACQSIMDDLEDSGILRTVLQ